MAEPTPAQLATLLRASLRLGKPTTLVIASSSMAPLLRAGDEVTLLPARPAELKAGDIVTVETGSHLLTHRYWGRIPSESGHRLLTKGDRPWRGDEPWPETRLVGLVVARRRRSRTLSLQTGRGKAANSHLAWLALVERKCGLWERPFRSEAPRRPWPKRLLRQLLYVWATAVTTTLTSFPLAAGEVSVRRDTKEA